MQNQDLKFELNYLFDERKNIFQSLNYVNSFYQTFFEFDQLVLRHILHNVKIEYSLIDLEYSSFKSTVEQLFKSLHDDFFHDSDLEILISKLLLKIKYWFSYKISQEREISTKEQIIEITERINNEINKISKDKKLIATEVSAHSVLNALSEISLKANNLKEKEAFEYKSQFGNALLRKGTYVNKTKILQELGSKTEISDSIEIIKPKKIDLLSGESNWTCILNGKTVSIKISDKIWIERYHNREENIESGDSLKVQLRISYNYDPTKPKVKPSYEILKVEGIIKPQQNNEQFFL